MNESKAGICMEAYLSYSLGSLSVVSSLVVSSGSIIPLILVSFTDHRALLKLKHLLF